MSENLTLTARDGHQLGGYLARPQGTPLGGIVVLQEIFGVNVHIREVCDGFAADGYLTLAPALYDRSSRKGVELGYGPEDVVTGRKLRGEFFWEDTILDVASAADLLKAEALKVATVGYCWGGSISFLAAARLDIHGAVVYYGGQIMPYVKEKERCPLLMHFGSRDASIPQTDVARIQEEHPEAVVHVYDADHGFNCNRRGQFHEASAGLARERTLEFFASRLT